MANRGATLRILVLGDFSGHATGGLLRVDRDNFASVLREFAPRIELGGVDLTFAALSDFEPDNIYRQSELFAALRSECRQLYSEPAMGESSKTLIPSEEQIQRLTFPGGLLDAIAEKGAAPKDVFRSMIERIVAPYALPADNPETQRASIERGQRISVLMSHILHEERFQALEAAWRGLHLLVHGLDTDRRIHLHILDVSKERLTLELPAVGKSWELLAGNFAFDRSILSDVQQLENISLLAQSLGAPFIAECLPSQHENVKSQSAWQALRKSPAANYVGLALPRFLLRPPYGKETVPVESFNFEEMPGAPVHRHYLWCNPSFACALAIGSEEQGGCLRIGRRPLPATEVLLSGGDCQALLDEGLLPLAAVKGSDEIAFPRVQSIANPPAILAGFQSVSW